MIKRKNIPRNFIITGCLIMALFAGINNLFAQTTRYVPAQYTTVNAAINASVSGDTIDITGTFYESQINVSKSLFIRGHDSNNTIIYNSGSNQNVFSITNNVSVTISDMTIRNGRYGIYIFNANLNLIGCRVIYNTSCGIFSLSSNTTNNVCVTNSNINNNTGNGICNYGHYMYINNSSVNNNTMNASTAGDGGGIYNAGNLIVNNSTINNNTLIAVTWGYGGGIYNRGNLTINNSDISNNTLHSSNGSEGGGIYNAGDLTVNNSTISLNSLNNPNSSSGGGIYNRGNLEVNNCTISHNSLNAQYECEGGGIWNDSDLIISNSTISQNYLNACGCDGGGITNHGNLKVNNCTISNNYLSIDNTCSLVHGYGSGISNWDSLEINNTTITFNRSSSSSLDSRGLYTAYYGSTIIKNTILALNYLNTSVNQDYQGTIQSRGYNLVGQSSATDFNSTGDMKGVNPLIDTLNNNGGPTLTQALYSGSPAINAGSRTNINGDIVLLDQRGYFRGNTIDIGAYEHDGNKCGVLQINDPICNQLSNLPIIKILISASGIDSISAFSFNTTGTTNLADIQYARLYYTGSQNVFSIDSQFGTTITSPGNNFTINDNVYLNKGLNYFWLAYSLSAYANTGNNYDAACNGINFNSSSSVPYDSSPAGYRRKLDIYPQFMVNDSSQCLQENNFRFTNLSSIQDSTINFNWVFGDDSSSFQIDSVFHKYNDTGTYTVKLQVQGCLNSISKKVYVNPSPQALFTVFKPTQCLIKNRFLINNSSKIPKSADTLFYWNFGDMMSDTLRNAVHHYTKPDTFNIMLIVNTSLGCSDSQTKQVVVHPSAVAAFSINDTDQCYKGNLFQLTNQTTGSQPVLTNYIWKFGDGSSDTATHQAHSYLTYDTFQVHLTAKTNMGCNDSVAKSLVVFPNPKAGFIINDSIQCRSGNEFVFTDTVVNQQPAKIKYHWNFDDNYTDTLQNTAHSYLSDDTFSVSLISYNDYGCGDTARKQLIVNPSPTADYSVSDSVQCFHDNYFTFTNRSSINKGTITFFWDFGNAFTSKVFETSINYDSAGVYITSLKAISGLGCIDSFKMKLLVNPEPVAAFTIDDSLQCFSGNKFRFTNKSSILTDTFSNYWNFGDHSGTIYFSPDHSYPDTGSYIIKLITTSAFGCIDSMTKTVEIAPDPIVQSAIGGEHCGSGQLSLFAKALNGSINWYSSDVGGNLLYQGDTFVTNAGTTYYVEAVNQACSSSPRTAVTALVKYVPTITSTVPSSRWYAGTVTLKAFASAGVVNWYDTATGGVILTTGTSFTTPVISKSKTYYVDASYLGCTTDSRTAIIATVLPNSINDLTEMAGLIFYPNPANDFMVLEINGLKEKAILTFIDVQGRVVKSINIQPLSAKFSIQIDIKNLPQGLYLLNLKNDNVFRTGRLVKY
jgi:PKD repeat protein